MRLLRLLLPLAFLASCDLGAGLGGLVGPRQVSVLGDALIVRAPLGYCVDKNSARGGDDSAALLIGRCSPLGRFVAALVTVTVGRAGSAGVMAADQDVLRAFMASDDGRRLLARSGRAEDVKVIESAVIEGRLLLHLDDRDAGEYWRAVLGLNGRLVTVSALGPLDAPLAPDKGRKLLDQTIQALISANPRAEPKAVLPDAAGSGEPATEASVEANPPAAPGESL